MGLFLFTKPKVSEMRFLYKVCYLSFSRSKDSVEKYFVLRFMPVIHLIPGVRE